MVFRHFHIIPYILSCSLAYIVHGLPDNKIYRNSGEAFSKNGIQTEPNCEELRSMWRFSKRQSRAAELTNELPMFRDHFVNNYWQPFYATSRSIGGFRRPVYGRVIHNAPFMRIQDPVERQKAFEEITKLYQMPPVIEPRKPVTTFRLSGGSHLSSLGYPPQSGSFNHLKEIIKTERARELQQERLAEEKAARAMLMKQGTIIPGRYQTDPHLYDETDMFSREDLEKDRKLRVPDGIIAFPDLLAPSSNFDRQVARFVSGYSPGHSTARIHSRGTPFIGSGSHFYSAYPGQYL